MKNKKILIIGVILFVVICATALGVLYFTTDLFKTEQQLFYKYLAQTEIIDYDFVKQLNMASDKINKNNNSSSANLSFDASSQDESTGIADVKNIFTVKSNGLSNVLTNQAYRDFVVSQNSQNLLTLRYLRDGNTYAIGADNILTKYLAVDNTNLKDLFTKLGVKDVSKIPNSIPTNYGEILEISDEMLEQFKRTYGIIIYNNIPKEKYYKIENDNTTQRIGIHLSEQEFCNVIKLLLETAKNDTALLNLIIDKAKILNYNDITVDNLQMRIQNSIEKMSTEKNNYGFVAIGDNDNKSIKDIEYKIELIEKEKKVIGMNLEMIYTEQIQDYENSIDEGFKEIEQRVNNLTEIDFREKNKITVLNKKNGIEIFKYNINYSYDKNSINCTMWVETKENEKNNSIDIQYQINNIQTDNIIQKCNIDLNFNTNENYKISMINNITLKQDVIISKLTTENSAKLNDMSSLQLRQLFIALTNRIMVLYGENLMDI